MGVDETEIGLSDELSGGIVHGKLEVSLMEETLGESLGTVGGRLIVSYGGISYGIGYVKLGILTLG